MVRIKTVINPDARTTQNLGREREGSGIVIDDNGLILTIGYLMVEAHTAEVTTNDGRTLPASIVGYDHETGFGLLQAIAPLKVKPMAFGKSSALARDDVVIVASFGGPARAAPARILAKREFAGSWEYLLDEAIFTSPPHPAWSGAALINREGKLVGIGSLIVADALGDGSGEAGNMFVPVDLLAPILGDLIADGRASRDPRPWIGVTTNEVYGRLVVSQVTPHGPAEKAGLTPRRHHHRNRRSAREQPARSLPENLGAGECGRDRAARLRARGRQPSCRRAVDEPARSPQAEEHVLTLVSRAQRSARR